MLWLSLFQHWPPILKDATSYFHSFTLQWMWRSGRELCLWSFSYMQLSCSCSHQNKHQKASHPTWQQNQTHENIKWWILLRLPSSTKISSIFILKLHTHTHTKSLISSNLNVLKVCAGNKCHGSSVCILYEQNQAMLNFYGTVINL